MNRNLTIKDIKTLIYKKFEIDEKYDDNKSNLTKSAENASTYINKKTKVKVLDAPNVKNEKNSNLNLEKNETIKSLEIESLNKNRHKTVNLFFKGKELINEDEIIGNLVSNNGIEELELSVIILSLSDSSFIDENKTKEKLINKVCNKCLLHKNNKELFICTTCNVAFCKFCSNKHNSHDIIERKDIVKFNQELKNLKIELNKKLEGTNLTNIYQIKENNNSEYNNNIEKLQNRLDNIKKIYRGIINNYKRDIDKSLPYLLEYKEKVEHLIENSYNLDTLKDEQQFIDYYYWYTNIKEKQEKIKIEINELDKIQKNFNTTMLYFDEKIKSIYASTNDDYKFLKNLYYNKNVKNQYQNSASLVNNNEIPKLNLLNIFNKSKNAAQDLIHSSTKLNKRFSNDSNEISSLLENFGDIPKQKFPMSYRNKENNNIYEKLNDIKPKSHLYNSKIFKNKIICEEIEEKSEKEDSQEEISISSQRIISNKIYNIKPNTQNIFYFDIKSKKIEEKKVNFEKLSFEYFAENQSILNYKNNFYISGGSNLKIFYRYDQNLNKFVKLKEMLTVHSSHGILGMGDDIYVISGSLSTKFERYDINDNSWENLNELNESRIWPSCFGFNKKYIFVLGGIKNNFEENIIQIEKIDLSSNDNKWEKINFNFKKEIKLRYNFGLINLMNNSFLIIGGKKNDKNCNEVNDSLRIMINNKKLDIEKEQDLILNKNEEFNGKTFAYFGDGLYGEFSSLSHRTFYLINILTKTIEEIN